MTEKEKMLAGMLYRLEAGGELEAEQTRAKELCLRFNQIPQGNREEREKVMRQILGKAGKNLCVEPSFWCDYGSNISVGDDFYANHNCVMLDVAPITFGDRVLVAPNCGFYAAGHPLNREIRNRGLELGAPITVGSDVWIGGNVTVLGGVTIGDNVVIGAGSVVVHDIPSGVVAVGNPCRPIKTMEEACARERFLEIRPTEPEDMEKILEIYGEARRFMAATGNKSQWNGSYPGEEDVREDMKTGSSYVCLENGEVAATFFFRVGEEPNYRVIQGGSWLNDRPYGVVHRIAVGGKGRGIAAFCLDWCLKQCGNVKIDTHRDNLPMQKALEKNGFVPCGIIYVEDGTERIAFQKCEPLLEKRS